MRSEADRTWNSEGTNHAREVCGVSAPAALLRWSAEVCTDDACAIEVLQADGSQDFIWLGVCQSERELGAEALRIVSGGGFAEVARQQHMVSEGINPALPMSSQSSRGAGELFSASICMQVTDDDDLPPDRPSFTLAAINELSWPATMQVFGP